MSIKQKSLFKKLSALILVFAVFVVSASAISSNAASSPHSFCFQIVANGKVSKEPTKRLRSTHDQNNAWMVQMDTSTESPNGTTTITKFHLGVDNPNGINPMGSESYIVRLKFGEYRFPAYANASGKYVYLYGKDNYSTNHAYTVSGIWNEETGLKPNI